jgi:hypothetical protein
MAHWAQIDENNIVTNVTVGDDNDPGNDEGYQWLVDNLGGTWIKTSYNTYAGKHLLGGTPLRKNYAGIGFTYDEERDAFIPPKPYESWILNEETALWEAPSIKPDCCLSVWDEDLQDWVQPETSEES